MDQMEKEYQHWQSEFADTEVKLREQEKINDDALQPVQDKLALVEEQIREMKSKIQNMRSQVMRNDTTIQNLLNSVIASN